MARGAGDPGMALVVGESGSGKTANVSRMAAQFGAALVTVNAAMGFGGLLRALCGALGVEARRSNAAKFDAIVGSLRAMPRALAIDEADRLRDERCIEVLRDIHDAAGVPVVLAGMPSLARRLAAFPQVERRLAARLEFGRCGADDAARLAAELCEADLEPALVERMHALTGGSVGLAVVALGRFERLAREKREKLVTLAMWGDRPMFERWQRGAA
jgi:DNA transposition AAA+ family ATPase